MFQIDKLIPIYNGSEQVDEVPTFGLDFYCTESEDSAKEWAVSSLRNGFANRYTLDTEYLNILNLNRRGIEIVLEVIFETLGKALSVEPQEYMGRSREYWIGWSAADYQWHSGQKYSDIFIVIPFEDMQKMYYTLHEADITKFIGIADQLMKDHFTETNLKRIRTAYGCTQAELARHSGVSLTSIQMYEQ